MKKRSIYTTYTTKKSMAAYLALQEQEVEANYAVFKKRLPQLLKQHRGQYALMKNGELLDIFDKWEDAYAEGGNRFPDFVFSAHEISDEVADFGIFSRI